jgi:hypothetical protein
MVSNEEWNTISFIDGNGTTTEMNSYSFLDENLQAGKYQYRLKQNDFDGSYSYSNIVEAEIQLPNKFVLNQNFPNPFNPSTKISYYLPVSCNVVIKIFNSIGQEVKVLVNEYQEAGANTAFYNVQSNLPSGIYFYELNAGSNTQTKKMVLLQ